jgi:hypothetical protein
VLLLFHKPTLSKETTAYVVHGEADQAEAFARRLLEAGMGAAEVPAMESSLLTSASGLPETGAQDSDRVVTDGD